MVHSLRSFGVVEIVGRLLDYDGAAFVFKQLPIPSNSTSVIRSAKELRFFEVFIPDIFVSRDVWMK